MSKYRDYSKFNKESSFGTISEKNFQCPWYLVWYNLKKRCTNSKCSSYKNYGGRGIGFLLSLQTIKKLWFRDKAYLMKRPSIDRIDNNSHYTYENCRFVELSENVKKSHIDRKNRKEVVNYLKNRKLLSFRL